MKWLLIVSWRNLWRNPKRTSVILVSVTIGIAMMLFMSGIMWGMVQGMLDTSLANLTGHIQIHHPDYRDDPAIENRLRNPEKLRDALDEILPTGSKVAWRVRFDVVANNARHSGGFTLVGTDMRTAMDMTFLKTSRLEGGIPDEGSKNGILVGKALLEDFETEIGNKLILMARDTSGEISSRAFQITGNFDTYLESNETGFAFVITESAQEYLDLDNGLSELSIMLPDISQTEGVVAQLEKELDDNLYAVTPWQENIPLVTAYIEIWDFFAYIWGLVVFVAMAFGLVNTLLMAVYERIREFGLVRALGTQRSRIVLEVIMESILLLLVGLFIGNLLAIGVVGWLKVDGIDLTAFSASSEMFGMSRVVYPDIQAGDFVLFNCLVFVLGLLVSLYPAIKASRFTPIEAMTHFK